MAAIIEIERLNKHFGDIHAVRDLTFQVQEGELFAFLGVNGAGKSTTISIMSGLLPKDSGRVIVDGADLDRSVESIKGSIGVVYQQTGLDQPLTVRENLECRAALYGITGQRFRTRLKELSDLLDLDALLKRPLAKLSGGQRRRIDVARALLHHPRLLILDEPTTGLDPQTRQMLWSVISGLRQSEGMTVFLTTHYMEEAADADSVVILDSGSIAAQGTPLALKNAYAGDYITLFGVSHEQAAVLGCPVEPLRDGCRVSVSNTAAATELILRHPELFVDHEITKGRMDDVFLAATGKKLSVGGEA